MDRALFQKATPADLSAFGIAHETNAAAGTGCTVVVAPHGAVCGVDVRGGGPATRETDLLRPENMIQKVQSIVIAGGSAFGLAASCGVMDALAEERIGFELGGAYVPIVVQACLFDLLVGENAFPGHDEGYAAARAALAAQSAGMTDDLAQGNVGAGCGATVGKLLGPDAAMKGGFGWAGVRAGELVVVALAAVNACGCVRDRNGRWIAGCHDGDGHVIAPDLALGRAFGARASTEEETPCTNTTLGVVLTNARLTKAEITKAASMTQDAYARAIAPVHTMNDGDTVFAASSGEVAADTNTVGMLACEAMQDAIVSAVEHAEPAYGLPAAASTAR